MLNFIFMVGVPFDLRRTTLSKDGVFATAFRMSSVYVALVAMVNTQV